MRRSRPDMKLTHQRMTGRFDSTPESVLDWLEEQLECRGIDTVVYTRYILSLLQDYDSDEEEEAVPSINSKAMSGFCCDRVVRRHSTAKENLRPVTTNKYKHRRYRTTCPDIGQDCAINSDYERKLAVVQCLKSASDQEFGIESFVDELCDKLKNIKLLSENVNELSPESKSEVSNNNNGAKVSPKEQARKYYDAFPALDHNCNEDTTHTTKVAADIIPEETSVKPSLDRNKWNGQKIIEFINCNTCGDGLTPDLISPQNDDFKSKEQNEDKPEINLIDFKEKGETKENVLNIRTNFYYCEDIESKVMDVLLVDNQSPNKNYLCGEGIQEVEENDKFERLVNKFNGNIASIWSTAEPNPLLTKSENIWSFDSSFSSNQSSATPSPKTCAIDLWSTLSTKELKDSLNEKMAPTLKSWSNSVFNALSDDGFIDGNHDFLDEDINWCLSAADLIDREANRTSLQNHKKNSPFIEVNSFGSSNGKTSNKWQKDSQFDKLLSLASLLEKSDNRLTPVLDENLLTSSKTHFQPIKQDSFERDDSEDESLPDLTDKEVKKLVICSEKCPNNSDTKPQQNYDSLKFRPISTSFGELASFMGPFNDFEWSSSDFSKKVNITELKGREMSDKSTNTESECSTDMKTKLPAIVETSVESEPEYQDLYQMINEVLRNGISEDNTPIDTSSLALSDEPEINNNTDNESNLKKLSNSYLDGSDCHSFEHLFTDSQKNVRQKSSSEYTVDEAFGDELFYKNTDFFQHFGDYEEVFDNTYAAEDNLDTIYTSSVCDYPTANSLSHTRQMALDSQMNLQYKLRHNQNVGQSGPRVAKPCTFFIEGNCKRSDCKYSHKISAITCKYWEEGFCFKAELCPFLHGYLNDANQVETDVTSPQSKSYAIESESDFPSLSIKSDDSQDLTGMAPEVEPSGDNLEQHFFDFHTKSVADNNGTVGAAKAKLPIAVFMKKKLRKRKDRNLQ